MECRAMGVHLYRFLMSDCVCVCVCVCMHVRACMRVWCRIGGLWQVAAINATYVRI